MKINIDKFASITKSLFLENPVEVTDDFKAEAGTVVVVEALTENPLYPDLELIDGTFAKIKKGDVFVGVFGSRQALRGFVGYSPYRVAVGETIQLLNMGGVVGRCVDAHADLGKPIQLKILGALPTKLPALPPVEAPVNLKPIVLVLGSCMHVGKTQAAAEIIKQLSDSGLTVAAAKVSGVACMRDTRKMKAAGAVKTASFVDCGLPSSIDTDNLGLTAKTLASHLSDSADVIVMELGDGILGHYNVEQVLHDGSFMGHVTAVVFAASDMVAAWGGIELLTKWGIPVTALTGPVTDTMAGTEYVESSFGVPAANAVLKGAKLKELILKTLPVPA